jgi:(p)ppGpp synthase/HD superfamily hydrolase
MESKKDLIGKAIVFAQEKHRGQVRKDGTPYIIHPLRVSEIVRKFKKSHSINEIMAAAILHDTLEDTNTSIPELMENFGELITMMVIELTSEKNKIEAMGKVNYLSEKLSSSKIVSRWALVIKLADRLDNVSDLDTIDDNEFVEKIKRETEEILNYLEKNRELTPTQKRLVNAIRAKLRELNK